MSASSYSILHSDSFAANERGVLSQEQRSWLKKMGNQSLLRAVFLTIAFGMTGCFLLVPIFLSRPQGDVTIFLLFIVIAISSLLTGGFVMSTVLQREIPLQAVWESRNPSLRQGQGSLVFDKNRYALQDSLRTYPLPASATNSGLKPGGVYRFYSLEQSGLVLSAQEVFAPNPAQTRNAVQEALCRANRFSPEELESNKAEEISLSQRKKLLPQLLGGLAIGAFLLFILLALSPELSAIDDQESLRDILIPIVLFGFFLLVGGIVFARALLDALEQSPHIAEGKCRREKRITGGKNRRVEYFYVLDTLKLRVNENGYNALIDDLSYRVYYLPRTKILLSIEPLSQSLSPDPLGAYNA